MNAARDCEAQVGNALDFDGIHRVGSAKVHLKFQANVFSSVGEAACNLANALDRTGGDARSDSQELFLTSDATGPHTPFGSPACARGLGEQTPILGLGVETVGTDAGAAHSFDPPFPCHAALMGNGKYGLTQLQNLAQLPPTGAVLVVAPLPIVSGSGSPSRVLALVER